MKFPAFDAIDLKNNVNVFSVEELRLSCICPNLNQPRKNFEEEALKELALSIKEHGVIQPIIVQKCADKQYEIIAGERRWRAAKLAGLTVIPSIIQMNTLEKNVALSLIENIQRADLNPIELAQALQKLSHEYGLSHAAMASMIGKSRAMVTNLLRLLNLTNEVQQLLIAGKLEMGHARALLALPEDQQIVFAKKIIKKHLTVRRAEKLVRSVKTPAEDCSEPYACEVRHWVHCLSSCLTSKVAVDINRKGKGKVIIHFESPEQVDELVERFSGNVLESSPRDRLNGESA